MKTDFNSSELTVMMLQKQPQFGPQHPGESTGGLRLGGDADRAREQAAAL